MAIELTNSQKHYFDSACMMNSTARYGQSRCQWMKHMDKFEKHRILLAALQMTAL